MRNLKFSLFWFTFKIDNGPDNLIYSCINNHYIDEWMVKHGYVEFTNILTLIDLDLFIHDLVESGNLASDDFSDYFPAVSNYPLIEPSDNWSNVGEYRTYSKDQMELLFNKLWEVSQDSANETVGELTYHKFY